MCIGVVWMCIHFLLTEKYGVLVVVHAILLFCFKVIYSVNCFFFCYFFFSIYYLIYFFMILSELNCGSGCGGVARCVFLSSCPAQI